MEQKGTMDWGRLITNKRFGKEEKYRENKEYRTDFQRDFDRLIFSAPFRRMQNKTQVFPLPGSIFVHNRLTHSLEVSSVGRSLGTDVARELQQLHPELRHTPLAEIGNIVSAACLAHDMGNPPFGHAGEKAIASYFKEGRGQKLHDFTDETGEKLSEEQWHDLTRFDGNANAFRLLTHQFEGRRKGGFVMCYPTLAAIVKYPYASTYATTKQKFGFFNAESTYFRKIADEMGMIRLNSPDEPLRYARHPLVYLVEAADDICYEIMDIEDAHKLRILSDEETFHHLLAFFSPDHQEKLKATFAYVTDINEQIVYLRSCVINSLEHACVRTFIDHESDIMQGRFEGSLIEHLPEPLLTAYRRCEEIAKKRIYCHHDVLDVELAGYRIIYTLLELFMDAAVLNPHHAYGRLLLSRVSSQYQLNAPHLYDRVMAVLDYISGMTDVYALDLYRKINGNSLPMV